MGLLYVRTGNGGANGNFLIADLGYTVLTGASWTLLAASSPSSADGNSGLFSARELRDSADLFAAVTAGQLEWSQDGIVVENASDYVADFMLMQDFTDDYLNLTDGRLSLPNASSVPASGVEGEIFWDNDEEHLYIHDGNDFVLIATTSGVNTDHGALVGLGDDDHTQYGLLAGNATRNAVTGKYNFSSGQLRLPQAANIITSFPTPEEGDIAWDTDDEHLYMYDGTQWITIATPSGIITHHGDFVGLEDDDHPHYPEWATTETISGLWTFSTADDDPAFIIEPDSDAPTTNLADGAVSIVGGILYTYDATRSKWLSVDRKLVTAAKKGAAKNVYLRHADTIATSETGFRALRNGTITGITAQTDTSESWILEIRRNDTATVLTSVTMSSQQGNQDTTINIDFSQGDELQFFANVSGTPINSPIGAIEIAWRI